MGSQQLERPRNLENSHDTLRSPGVNPLEGSPKSWDSEGTSDFQL
jgi:hypothetical protein